MSQVEFEKKGGFLSFVTKFDRYADPITLSYNRQKVHKTCHGGILTIIAFCAILGFLGSHIYDMVFHQYTYSFTLHPFSDKKVQKQEDSMDGFSVPSDQLIVAHNFVSMNTTLLPHDEIRNYFDAVYVQIYDSRTSTPDNVYYQSVSCDYIQNSNEQFKQVYSFGYYCPSMPADTHLDFEGFPGYSSNSSAGYRLYIGTCEELSPYTNRSDCQSQEDSEKLLDYVYANVEVWTTYFDPRYYLQHDKQNQYVNSFYKNHLMKDVQQERFFSMRQELIHMSSSWLLPIINKDIFSILQIADKQQTLGTKLPNQDNIVLNSYIVFSFSANPFVVTSTYTCSNIMGIFTTIGGFMYTIKNLGNAANKNVNKFQVDNSMIARLYSSDRQAEGHMTDIVEEKVDTKTGRQELIDCLEMRERWIYRWRDACCPPKDSGCSCKCCFCKKRTLKDKLFDKGRKKLYDEIDILRIVKQLRVNSFVADLILTKGQEGLVRWFDKYKIEIKSDDEENQDSKSKSGGNKVEPLIEDVDSDELSSFDQLMNSVKSSGSQKKRRESFYEDHHLFVTDELRDQAKETLQNFDCSQHMIDQLILARVQGFQDLRTVMAQLGKNVESNEKGADRLSAKGLMGKLIEGADLGMFIKKSKYDSVPTDLNNSQRQASKSSFRIVRRAEARPITGQHLLQSQEVFNPLRSQLTKSENRRFSQAVEKPKKVGFKKSKTLNNVIEEQDDEEGSFII